MGGELYFSEREEGVPEPRESEIGPGFWQGIIAAVQRRINDGSFAESFPRPCWESPYPIETNEGNIGGAFRGENPAIAWPLSGEEEPGTLPALDAVEFFAKHVSYPAERTPHTYCRHDHITRFDRDAGKRHFLEEVNTLFRRNGHPYRVADSGRVERVASPALAQALGAARFTTVDATLNTLLQDAVGRFKDPDPAERKVALEKLWDAWERIKSIRNPNDKKSSTEQLIGEAVAEPELCQRILAEATALNEIGNKFQVRHFETNRVEIARPEHVDYLFHRLFALVWLCLPLLQQGDQV